MLIFYVLAAVILNCCNSAAPAIVLIDSFSHSISGYVKDYCKKQGIKIIEAISGYTFFGLTSQGAELPPSMRAPDKGTEQAWINERLSDDHALICCISESDAGVPTAERISVALGLPSNGVSEHLRNKYDMNERLRIAGLPTAQQYLSADWAPLQKALENDPILNANGFKCVVKPYRGVASDGVCLCESVEEAEIAFHNLLNKPKYGGGKQDRVLVQEYLEGDEYAIDTVSSNGKTKITAVWRYTKLSKNDAPFVYQCSELVDGVDAEGALLPVCDYCLKALDALGVAWGPTHTEIKMTAAGPRMVEVNARWHAQDFCPITRACLGTDSLVTTIDAFVHPSHFEALPLCPPRRPKYGMIVHLISVVEGTVSRVAHLEEIRALPSFMAIELSYEVGDVIVKTTDIRTDSGYALIAHESNEVLQRDFKTICGLQYSLFEVE